MFKRILATLDGSPLSEQILPYASGIARKLGADLSLLRVVVDPADQEGAREYVETMAARADAHPMCIVADGDIAAAIRAETDRVPDTLIAICSHGRSGAAEAILGSIALRVLRTGNSPMLVYRPDSKSPAAGVDASKIETIVLPLDGGATSESMMPQAAALALALGAQLLVVSVVESSRRVASGIPAGDVMESSYVHGRAQDLTERYGVRTGWEVLHGDPKEAIPSFVRMQPNAMLAMTTQGRGAIETVLVGSVTAACLRESGVPVFTRLP